MLPFLKKKDSANVGVQIIKREPDGPKEPEQDSGLMAAAKDLIKGIHSQDEKAVAAAFRAAFEILESQPHDEFQEPEQE